MRFKRLLVRQLNMYRYGKVLHWLLSKMLICKFLDEIANACQTAEASARPTALQVITYLEKHLSPALHPHPVLLKLYQRLTLPAHDRQATLEKALLPYLCQQPIQDVEAFWLRFQEGIWPQHPVTQRIDRCLYLKQCMVFYIEARPSSDAATRRRRSR